MHLVGLRRLARSNEHAVRARYPGAGKAASDLFRRRTSRPSRCVWIPRAPGSTSSCSGVASAPRPPPNARRPMRHWTLGPRSGGHSAQGWSGPALLSGRLAKGRARYRVRTGV